MKTRSLIAALLLAASALPASAITFDFYKLGRGPAVDFLPTDGVACTGGDLCSSNVGAGAFGDDLTFSLGGITVHATGSFNGTAAAVVQDATANWTATNGAGLGVYHAGPVNNSDDNITTGETLTLTFEQAVNLSAIGLRSDGHNFTNWADNSTFLFDGVQTALPKGTGFIGDLDKSGTVFSFAYGGNKPGQFYLSSVTVTPVPEPETLALMLSGIGFVGFMARRRRRHA